MALYLHVRVFRPRDLLTWLRNVWRITASARWAFVVKKYIINVYFVRQWALVYLDKTLIPRDFEAALKLTFGPSNGWTIICSFSLKTLFPFFDWRHEHLTWGRVNYQGNFILKISKPLTTVRFFCKVVCCRQKHIEI